MARGRDQHQAAAAALQALDRAPPESLRFLETTMWSEVLPAQILAVRALRRLDVDWARDALDGLWLPEEVEARI